MVTESIMLYADQREVATMSLDVRSGCLAIDVFYYLYQNFYTVQILVKPH